MSLRVTQNAMTSLMLAGLQDSQARMSTLQQQLSSGKQISKPSDDPVGTDQAMRYRGELARSSQYQRNANDGLSWLGSADQALQQGVAILRRVQVLATQAANVGSGGSDSQAAIATEMQSLKQEMLGVANATYLGRPIFGGTTSKSAAYVQDALGNVTYQGDSGAVMRTVDTNTQVQVNISNVDAFGAAGNDVFSMFDQITSDLQTNPNNLTNDLSLVSTALGRMTNAQAKEGAAYNRINDMNNSMTSRMATLTNNLSDVEDLDTAKAATELTMQQASYEASLAAMSKVLQLSLTDFLR